MEALLKSTPLAAVMNTLVDGAIIIDASGTVRMINSACEDMFGYRPEEVEGRNVHMLMPEPYHSEHDGYLGRYVRTGEARIIGIGREVEGRRKSGEVFPLDLAVGELDQGGVRYFVGILRDLSAKHARQREYDDLQARHFHLSRVAAMNEMGAAIAHEINQPLAATANYIETARILAGAHPDTPGPVVEALGRALEQNQRASEIISRMRSFIERGDVAARALDIGEVVDASLMLGLSNFRQAGIRVEREEAPLPGRVQGDPVQVQQVLVNLVRNACEAMAGRKEKVLGVCVEPDPEAPGFARITVSDTGTGLSEDVVADLFTAFTSTKAGGMGVGLSISRSIVRAHGGRIWAADRPGGGAAFTFTLPLDVSGSEA